MKRLIREPLIHFLLLGGLSFGAYSVLNHDEPASPESIVVSSGQIENLTATFAKVWQRPPTSAELKGLVDEHVKEEILSREAVKLSLDQNDTIIRRRLRQKMEFLTEDFAAVSEPTEVELADYFGEHPERFAQEQRFTFRQVFLSPEKRGDQLNADAAALLAELNGRGADADVSVLGDSFLLPYEFTDEPQRAVAAQFGRQFAAALGDLKAEAWAGPFESGYGVHLVLVTRRTEGRLPALDEVREEVKREFLHERRIEAGRRFLDGLLAKYQISIEWPVSGAEDEAQRSAMNR